MAKRFTDTNKWDHAWIRKLSPRLKCALFYILDKCDHAGIWISDFEAMSFNVGETISQAEFESTFSEKVKPISEDKYFIESFIEFQYGNLNPLNRVHQSVISKIEKQGAYKTLNSSFQGAKDKDKVKEKEKDKEQDKEKGVPQISKSDLGQQASQVIARYCELWKAKYKTNVSMSGKWAGNAKTLIKDHGLNRSLELVESFMEMNDSWFLQNSHSFDLILTKLASIARYDGTGTQFNKTQAIQLDKSQANIAAGDDAAAFFRKQKEVV